MQLTDFVDAVNELPRDGNRHLVPAIQKRELPGDTPVAYPRFEITYQNVRDCGPIRAILTELRGAGGETLVLGGNRACLSCFIETIGAPIVLSERAGRQEAVDRFDAARSLSFIPAGRSASGIAKDTVVARHLVLEFSPKLLQQVAHSHQVTDFDEMRPGFSDSCLALLCQIFASEVMDVHHCSELFVGSLGMALATRLAVVEDTKRNEQGGLAPWQYRRVIDYMMARLGEQVSLEKLAALVQLSKSYFCRAFRVTVGVTPYQWQLNARVRHAKSLILRGNLPLAQIALEAGFADQAHFTRVFRKFEGVCPGQWMRCHCQPNGNTEAFQRV